MASIQELKRRAAERKAGRSGRLSSAGYFYKADRGGMSVSFGTARGPLNPNGLTMEHHALLTIDAAIRDYDEGGATPEELFEQLDLIVAKNAAGEPPDAQELAVFVWNVAWLTARGHLRQDEYNGTLFSGVPN